MKIQVCIVDAAMQLFYIICRCVLKHEVIAAPSTLMQKQKSSINLLIVWILFFLRRHIDGNVVMNTDADRMVENISLSDEVAYLKTFAVRRDWLDRHSCNQMG